LKLQTTLRHLAKFASSERIKLDACKALIELSGLKDGSLTKDIGQTSADKIAFSQKKQEEADYFLSLLAGGKAE
jgi:hypothetical protein